MQACTQTPEAMMNYIDANEKHKVYAFAIKKTWNQKFQSHKYRWWILTEYHEPIAKECDNCLGGSSNSSLFSVRLNHDKIPLDISKDFNEMSHSNDTKVLFKLNEQLQERYKRHPVIHSNDLNWFLDPQEEIYKVFDNIGKDVCGNWGNVHIVTYKGIQYILKHRLSYVWDRTKDAKEAWRSDGCIKEMEMSYLLEDLNISHARKVHHILTKRVFSQRAQEYQNFFYVLMEYIPGDSVMDFDYSVTFRGHKEGRKVSIFAAKRFMKEVFEVYLQLLHANMHTHQFNDNNIIMEYNNGEISWGFVNYSHYETPPQKITVDDVRWQISNLKSMFGWRLCEYTGFSNHKLAKDYEKHPMWTELNNIFHKYYEKYNQIQKESTKADENGNRKYKGHGDWPPASLKDLISFSSEVLEYLK